MTKITFTKPGTEADLDITLGNPDYLPQVTHEAEGFFDSLLTDDFKKKARLNLGDLAPAAAAAFADGLMRGAYHFDKYKTEPQKEGPATIAITTSAPRQAAADFAERMKTTESTDWASDFVNEPGNILNPIVYTERVKEELEPLGVKVRVIEADEMKELGMGAALAVGQGSEYPPRMVVLEYDGTHGEQAQPLALVGKGITFDTGGYNLKPSHGMCGMGMDMAGSAAVAGAIRALAVSGVKTKVVGIMAIAENAIGPKSILPESIVPTMSGRTVSIDNTDAEGRLVMCDAITLAQAHYNAHTVMDFATLTGSIIQALGENVAGAFTNSDEVMAQFNEASERTGQMIHRMPLLEECTEAVYNTPKADITNDPAGPGASAAAAYLQTFIRKNKDGSDAIPFMHVDMAGPGSYSRSGRRGWGVDLIVDVIKQHYALPASANENVAQPQAAAAARAKTPKTAP